MIRRLEDVGLTVVASPRRSRGRAERVVKQAATTKSVSAFGISIRLSRRPSSQRAGHSLVVDVPADRSTLRRPEAEEFGDPKEPEDRPNRRRHELAALIVDDRRRCESLAPTACDEVAAAARKHVPHPLRPAAVGEGDHVPVSRPKDVHRRSIVAAGAPAGVLDDAEAGQQPCERPREAVRDPAVEPGHSPAEERSHRLVSV